MFTCLGLLNDFKGGYNLQEASSFSTSTPQYATPSTGKNYQRQGGQGCSRRLDLPGGEGEELREENALPTKQLAQSMVCEAPRPGKVSSAIITECRKVRFVLEDIRQTIIN